MISDFDRSSFRKYLAYVGGAAIAVGIGAHSLADYIAKVGEFSGIAEYSLEAISALGGAGAGMALGDHMYDLGIKGSLRKLLNFFYITSSTFIGGKGGWELAEILEKVEESTTDNKGLEATLAFLCGTIGLVAGIRINRAINEYNKKRKELTQ
ncbi:hypothetical protein KY343_05000 [Candidatus Woesearchaeota archaeon]|nr:hypothetical protein [Candidatus Woesearchaeota archaeon]